MKALTLIQPWATAIARGHKLYETRSWPAYGGRQVIAIHAGMKVDKIVLSDAIMDGYFPSDVSIPVGAIVAVARLDAVYTTSYMRPFVNGHERYWGNWEPGRYAWKLEDVLALREPIPCKGHQGLWTIPDDIEHLLIRAETL